MILKQKEAYQFWLAIHRNFPRVERMGIGQKIETHFLMLLELSFTSIYLPPSTKYVYLGKAISRLDMLRFFIQLAWESKLVPLEKYIQLIEKLQEIGRQLGGWKKGLEQKLPKEIREKLSVSE